MGKEYERFLVQIKSPGVSMDQDKMHKWELTAEMLHSELRDDLLGINLRHDDIVRNLLSAKFGTGIFENYVTPIIIQGRAKVRETARILAGGFIGNYPIYAYHVEVIAFLDDITVYFYKVPEDGQLQL